MVVPSHQRDVQRDQRRTTFANLTISALEAEVYEYRPRMVEMRATGANEFLNVPTPVYQHPRRSAAYAANQASRLEHCFEFIYTPKSASWLNMIECEFSVIARLRLRKRIATIEKLRTETLALLNERSAKQIRIN